MLKKALPISANGLKKLLYPLNLVL